MYLETPTLLLLYVPLELNNKLIQLYLHFKRFTASWEVVFKIRFKVILIVFTGDKKQIFDAGDPVFAILNIVVKIWGVVRHLVKITLTRYI